MKLAIVGVIFIGLTLPNVARAGHGGKFCWPSNATEQRCFSQLPPSVMPWPSKEQDSYTLDDVQVMDLEDYSVSSVQKDPRDVCQYKDALVESMNCLMDDMKKLCPDLPDEVLSKPQRLQRAFDGFCAQIDYIDPSCMLNHWQATMKCHDEIMSQMKQKPPKPRPTPPMPESESGSEYPKWGDDSEEHHDESDHKPKAMKKVKDWNKFICRMKYQMTECVRTSVETCHKQTADAMAQFIRDMSSANCSAMMQSWDATRPYGGASGVSVAWATVLSSALFSKLFWRYFG